MKKLSRIVVMAAALAGSIQALAAQDNADTRIDDRSAVEIAPELQSPTAETPAPLATVPLEMQISAQPVAAENMLSEMKVYPSF